MLAPIFSNEYKVVNVSLSPQLRPHLREQIHNAKHSSCGESVYVQRSGRFHPFKILLRLWNMLTVKVNYLVCLRSWGGIRKGKKKDSNDEKLTPWEYTSHIRALKKIFELYRHC